MIDEKNSKPILVMGDFAALRQVVSSALKGAQAHEKAGASQSDANVFEVQLSKVSEVIGMDFRVNRGAMNGRNYFILLREILHFSPAK